MIIGILAALVIIAYNGIQQKAQNTATITTVEAYTKALTQYAIDNQKYPPPGQKACLGDGYIGDQCWDTTVDVYVDPGFDTALQKYLPKKPKPSNKFLELGSADHRAGAALWYTNRLIYYLSGDQQCLSNDSQAVYGTTTQCIKQLPDPTQY